MAFLDLDAPPSFARRQPGIVLPIHEEWLTVDLPAAPRAPRWRRASFAAASAAAVGALQIWSAAALGSQLLGLAATGIVVAIALSLLNGLHR